MNNCTTRKGSSALALMAALGIPAAAGAQDLDFNYVELNYVNVDVDYSESLTEGGDSISLATDSGSGFHFGGAWQVWDDLHLFGEYSRSSQDVALAAVIGGEEFAGAGDFDVVRYRIGVGYALELTDAMRAYGRVSFDSIEFADFEVGGESVGDLDDDGLGAELGVLWAATPTVHMQAQARYTSVGEISDGDGSGFDADLLFGIAARWHYSERIAVQAGYEAGEISTWNAGVRFAF
jgi:hypothetical protein